MKMSLDMMPKGGQKLFTRPSNNFDMLVDLEVFFSLTWLMPLLNAIHCLIKFSQS